MPRTEVGDHNASQEPSDPGPAFQESSPAIWIARAGGIIGVVLAPILYFAVVGRLAAQVITPNTAHPLLVVAVVATTVAVAVGFAVVLARRPLRKGWLLVQLADAPWSAPERTFVERLRHPRRPDSGSLLTAVAEASAYAVVVAALFWPLGRLNDGIRAFPVDGQGWTWLGWRVSREMSEGHIFPTVLTDAMYPYDINLLAGDGYMTVWIGGVANLLAQPGLAYNLTQVVAVVLAVVAGRYLARACTDDRVAILVSTAAFAASPLILARFVGHQNLIFVFPSALVLAEVVRMIRSDFAQVRWVRLMMWLVLAYLSSIYYLLFALLVLAVAVVYCLVRRAARHRRIDQTSWWSIGKIGLACVLTLVVMSPFLAARFDRDAAERAAGAPAQETDTARTLPFSADLYSSIAPPPDSHNPLLRFASTPRDLETTAYPGLLLLLGLGGVVIVGSRSRMTLALSAVGLWLLTLGPTLLGFRVVNGVITKAPAFDGAAFAWLPYTLLLRVPGLTSLRTPVRSGFWLVPLGAAGLALLLGAVLRGRPPAVKGAFVVVGLLLVVGDIPASVPFIPVEASPAIEAAFDRIANDPTDRAVLVAPDDCLMTWGTSLFEVSHLHPVVGCTWYSSSVRWYSDLDEYVGSEAWGSVRCAPQIFGPRPLTWEPGEVSPDPGDLIELAGELDVGWIVLDKQPTQCNPERFAAIESLLVTHAELLGEDEHYAVFQLAEPPPASAAPR